MAIIDGKAVANEIQKELMQQIKTVKGRKPCLAMILVGMHPPSQIYVSRKAISCQSIGITSIRKQFLADIAEEALIYEIQRLNEDFSVDGILIQLPLPNHINPFNVICSISPHKDVDGLHPLNVGRMLIGSDEGFFPCTPLGIKTLLSRSKVNIEGKYVVILGRSNLVGKPLAAMLMQNQTGANATVTVVHSRSHHIEQLCKKADVLVAAMGQPHFVKTEMVKEGAVIIDVGINKILKNNSLNEYHIVGDVDFDQVQHKCSLITPVPGGVGPMTIAMLLSNTWRSYCKGQIL